MTQQQLLNLLSKAEKQDIRDKYGNKCSICGATKDKKGNPIKLAVEHDHALTKFKITTYNSFGVWKAVAYPYHGNGQLSAEGKTKEEAIRNARRFMVKESIRGLACFWCNRGLYWFKDSPELLEAAAKYLRRFNGQA